MPYVIVVIVVIIALGQIADEGGVALLVAFLGVPGWIAGMIAGWLLMLLLFRSRIDRLTSKENIGSAVSFSISSSRMNWELNESASYPPNRIFPKEFLSTCLGCLGAVCAAAGVSYWVYATASWDAKPFLMVFPFLVSVMVVPWCLVKMKPNRLFDSWLRRRIIQIMADFDSTLNGIDELRTVETSVNRLVEQLRIAFPANYVAEVEQHVRSHQVELVFERAAFSQFMDTRLQSARKDREELERAVRVIQEMDKLYLETAREVNRTSSVSMITESDWLGAGLQPENLPALLSVRKWEEFNQAASMMKEEMTALRERARKHGATRADSADTSAAPAGMTRREALRILGLSEDATFSAIERARKEAIKKFNVDHRQTLEPHIRELVEEKFKQVNMAFDFLKSESRATR